MAPPIRPGIVIGLDVGKSAHWACVVTREGELLTSGPIPNREDAIDGLYAQHPGALVVVDQVRSIGSLALSRAKLAGMPRAYLPGLAAHGASRLFAGDAKTDERGAMVIAKTALGIPDALLAVADRPPEIEAARSLAAQRGFLTCENTRSKNRLRSILLEPCPEFEAQADLSDPATLKLMAAVGGPWSISEAPPQAVGALTRGCGRAKVAALVESVGSSSRPHPAAVACEDRAVRLLARRISENAAEIESLTSEISALRDAQVPAHGARHRAANGLRAGHIHRHSRLPEPRQAGLALRAGAAQPAVRHVDIVGVGVAAGQQEAEEPARILVQLPGAQPQPMGRLLRALPRQGDAARQGAEGRGEEAAQGDLRDYAGQGPVLGLASRLEKKKRRPLTGPAAALSPSSEIRQQIN